MPCSKLIFQSAAVGTIYWGFADASVYGAFDFNTWDDTKIDAFLASLTLEVGPYRDSATGYEFPAAPIGSIGWLVVPDDYDTPTAATGFQFGFGIVGAPTGNVLTAQEGTDNQTGVVDANAPVNGWIGVPNDPASPGDVEDNVWNYFVRTVSGTVYRFYPFIIYEYLFGGAVFGLTFWNDGLSEDDMTLFIST